jgi:CO dehydrogenase/acetyl-CoA synthase gamma subunit (corrinoid Fe-S protein)
MKETEYQLLFNPLELYVPPVLPVTNCAFCTYGSCMILGVNIDYSLKQR